MDYDTDTITNAMRNRAASKKFFQQLVQQPRANAFMAFHQAEPPPPMLHRSPSGAQRKIKQRREEKCQQRVGSNNNNNNNFSSTTTQSTPATSLHGSGSSTGSSCATFAKPMPAPFSSSSSGSQFQVGDGGAAAFQAPIIREDVDYRSLRESNDYKSILDDVDDHDYLLPIQRPMPNNKSSHIEYTGISLINTFEKPEPAERTILSKQQQYTTSSLPTIDPVPTVNRSSHLEVDQKSITCNTTTSAAIAGSPTVTNITNTFNHNTSISLAFASGKPTVEVHPMPAPRINSLPPSVSPPDTLKKQPPPVPKKPAKLRRKFETVIGGDNCENVNHEQNMTSSSPPTNGTLNSSFSSSSSSLTKPSIAIFNLASVSAAPSTESLHLLCASPSLLSLQNSLSHAYSNPQEHSREQLEELERRRLQSIESLSKKVANREQDRDSVDDEIQLNDQLRMGIFGALTNHKSLVNRLEIHLLQSIRLIQLETRLQLQLEKLETAHFNPDDADYILARKRRTIEQLQDTKFLRSSHETREAELEDELGQLLNDNQIKEWIFFKVTAGKLHAERKQIEDRLSHVKAQLRSLLAMEPIVMPDHQNSSPLESPFQSSTNNVVQEPVSAN